MAEQHVLVGRHVIDAVLELVGRRDEVGIQLVDASGDVAGVDEVSGQEGGDPDDEQDDGAHAWLSVSARFISITVSCAV